MSLLVAALIAGPAWLRGGTHAEWLHAWPYAAAFVLAALIFSARQLGRREATRPGGRATGRLRRDPVFWLGLLFLCLLATQGWNAGRAPYFDATALRWTYTAPRHEGFPFAFDAGEARQMVDWFFPAWVILLALRSPVLSAGGIRLLWQVLVFQAGLLTLIGIAQFATGTMRMYGRIPMENLFFASFGYPNHAGSYLLLILPLCAGLLSREFEAEGEARCWPRIVALGAVCFLALVGANLSLSRSAILLSWALLPALGMRLLAYFWPRIAPAQRVNAVAAGAAVLCLAAMLTFGLGEQAIRREFKPESDNKTFLERESGFRLFQLQSAARIWLEQPWFGVGGWGYRYLMAHHLQPEEWRRVTPGKANVHNDPMQFLAEFGLIGAGAMAAVVLLLLHAAVRAQTGWPPLVLFPLLGVGLVWLQSLIDIPFRSPAVLYLWLACLAGASRAMPPLAPNVLACQLNVSAGGGILPAR